MNALETALAESKAREEKATVMRGNEYPKDADVRHWQSMSLIWEPRFRRMVEELVGDLQVIAKSGADRTAAIWAQDALVEMERIAEVE